MGITCDSSKLFTFHGTEWIKFWLWNKSCSRGRENQRTASIIQQPLLVQWRKLRRCESGLYNYICSVNVMLLYGLTSLWTNSLLFCEHAYIYCIFARLFFSVRDIQVQMLLPVVNWVVVSESKSSSLSSTLVGCSVGKSSLNSSCSS